MGPGTVFSGRVSLSSAVASVVQRVRWQGGGGRRAGVARRLTTTQPACVVGGAQQATGQGDPPYASDSALTRVRVCRIPARSSRVKVSWPPRAILVSLIETSEIPSGARRRWVTRVPVLGRFERERPDRLVVLDAERELAVRLEGDHLGAGGPHQRPAPVDVERAGAELDGAAPHDRADHLRAPLRHPGQIGHERPHLRRRRGHIDALLEQGLVLAHRFSVRGGSREPSAAARPQARADHQSSSAARACSGDCGPCSSRSSRRKR